MHFVPMVGGVDMETLAQQPSEVLADILQRCRRAEEEKVYQANPDVIVREVGDEWILVPTGSFAQDFNGMISFNEYSHFTWEQFQQPTSLGHVLDVARKVFEDEHSLLDMEIRNLINDFVRVGLLREV